MNSLIIHFGEIVDRIEILFFSFISSTILIGLTFQFLNSRYKKKYNNKYLYIILVLINAVVIVAGDSLMFLPASIITRVLCVGLISCFLYEEENSKLFIRIFESEAFMTILEAIKMVGEYMFDSVLELFNIMPSNFEIIQSIKIIGSTTIALLYYMVFSKLWGKKILKVSMQYTIYLLIFVTGISSIWAVTEIFERENPIILLFAISNLVCAGFYLLIFIKCLDESMDYKFQVKMMEQQEKLQYDNYKVQWEKYEKALSVLHDVKKHIMVIENLYRNNKECEAITYTKQINDMLIPIVPIYYMKNPIMNCLLSDKIRLAEKLGIDFQMEILTEDIDFMKPVDITTLFGNLFDNAIAASEKCDSRKYIGFFMESYNEMLSIKLENSILNPVPVLNGKISNVKRGIGLLNVQRCIDTYDGSILYKNKDGILECHILLSKI